MNISFFEKFKKVTSVALIFGLVFSTLTPAAFAATSLFSDSFGSSGTTDVPGWIDWPSSGDSLTSNTDPRSWSTTSYHLRVRDGDYVEKTVSTAGYNNIQLKYYWRGDDDGDESSGNTDTLDVYWKKSSDSTFILLNSYLMDGNAVWSSQVTTTLPATADNTSIDIRFVGNSNNDNEEGRIDDVSLEGDVISSDTTAPVISQVTAVPSPTADTTPSYTFTTDEAGTISYAGDCSSSTTAAVVGSNTITFNTLSDGIHSNCTIQVTDTSSNASNTLSVNSFTVDTTGPVITLLGTTPVTVEVGSVYTDAGATALDAVDGDRTANIITVNPVNSNTLGTYTVTYNVSDSLGNAATQVTRTVNVVDTTKPVISLIGSPTLSVNFGTSYTDAGATASDNVDGDITGSIVTVNPVDTGTLGTYSVTYNVTDANSNAADQVTRTVTVVDVTAPVINITGDNPMTIEVGGTYTELGANAVDDVDGTFAATPSGSVDTNTVGTYTINYNATDSWSNAATQVTRTINVVDTTAPVLTLLGITPVNAEWMQVYTDAGATASDNVDGDITANIITVNPVNTLVIGMYTVTYNVSDNAGNDATEITRTVNVVDTIAPIQSSVSVTPLNGSVSVKLDTHENATVVLSYGPTSSYGSSADITNIANISHDKTVLGLAPCSVYHYSIVATDIHGNVSSSSDGEFTTLGVGSCTGENNSGGSAQGGSPSSETSTENNNTNTTNNTPTTNTPAPTNPTTPTPTQPTTNPESTPEPTPTTPTQPTSPENTETPVDNTPTPTPTPTPTQPTNPTGNTTGGTGGATGGNPTPAFNPADATLDIGGAGTPEEEPVVEEAAPTVDPTLDAGGWVAVEGSSYTLLWTLLGLIALLNTWWFFVSKNKPNVFRRD